MDLGVLALTVWDAIAARVTPAMRDEIRQIVADAEPRRAAADYNTGSILEEEALALRALAEHVRSTVVIEVGTFIGTSTMALASASPVHTVYTCDVSNDCLPSSEKVRTFPKQSSTAMLRAAERTGLKVGLCFFDGVLSEEDVAMLSQIARPDAVFALHDYNYGPKVRKNGAVEIVARKGIGNERLISRAWPGHVLVDPMPGTTLALLVPEAML